MFEKKFKLALDVKFDLCRQMTIYEYHNRHA